MNFHATMPMDVMPPTLRLVGIAPLPGLLCVRIKPGKGVSFWKARFDPYRLGGSSNS
jgi:hypothetical protein